MRQNEYLWSKGLKTLLQTKKYYISILMEFSEDN